MKNWSTTYRGYRIERVNYCDCPCYIIPKLPSLGFVHDVALTVKQAKVWIDKWIHESRTFLKRESINEQLKLNIVRG
jgi:hypothetical protein